MYYIIVLPQFLGDIDDLLEWFGETERKIQDAPPITIDPSDLRAQLHEHRALQEDIANQKSKARDIMTGVKRMRRESSCDEDPAIGAKLEQLKVRTQFLWYLFRGHDLNILRRSFEKCLSVLKTDILLLWPTSPFSVSSHL